MKSKLIILSGSVVFLSFGGFVYGGMEHNKMSEKKGSMMGQKKSLKKDKNSTLNSIQEVKINKDLVCMINDKYMDGKVQIPVEVEGKIYYGCCQGCVAALNYKPSTRYSIDPFSGKEVDKSNAYIVLKSKETKEVLYFESQENYEKFINQ